jgi:hypothetical protein
MPRANLWVYLQRITRCDCAGGIYLLREGKIIVSQMILDFVDWFEQIGISFLPTSQGVANVYPAPTGFDGLLEDQ